ncbi:MAG: hypothetical protein M1357_00540 [Candidatus Marsarchaeota archaeon]|nr:hypothetical protein [Candidatus Marsarchaeota archaeon]
MRVIGYDAKTGSVTVQVTSPNDLWLLETVVPRGALVTSKTTRMTRSPNGEERGERVNTKLTVRVEKVSFEPFGETLRITGKIVDDPDELGVLGSYHTIVVDSGSVITVTKQAWTKEELNQLGKERLGDAVLIVSVDYHEVAIGRVWDYGVETVASWDTGIPGKGDPKQEEKIEKQLAKMASEIRRFVRGRGLVVFSGPGYFKQKVAQAVKALLASEGVEIRVTAVDAPYAGAAGIKEAVNAMFEKGFLKDARLSAEIRLLDEVLKEAASNNTKVILGLDAVEQAAEQGAVDTLLISTRALRDCHERSIRVVSAVEKYGGKVEIISDRHERGEQLAGMGGAAAFLRYAPQ